MKTIKSALQRILPAPSVVRLRALDYKLNSREECRLLRELCDPRKRSVDIGANVGTLTFFLARHSSGVHAYEPNPELAAQLRKAFGRRVTVVEAALSDVQGTATLKLPYYQGAEMHALASIAQEFKDAESVREFTVPLRRLDDENLANVGFVKIDVEQNEEKVLRGGMQLFARQRPNILLEVTPRLYDRSLTEFLSDFLDLDYHVYFLFDRRLTQLTDYKIDVHNHLGNLGVPNKFVTNVILSTRPLLG